MNPDQSGLKPLGSVFTAVAGADLTGKRSYLVELVNSSGALRVQLPNNIADDAFFQLDEAGASGDLVDVKPLATGEERRFVLKGTCNPGDRLSLAAIAGSDAGMVRTVPATTGTYRPFLIAREAGIDGQLVLAQVCIGLPTVIVP